MSGTKNPQVKIFLAVWLLIGALAVAFLPLSAWLDQFRNWIQALGWVAPFAYIAAYILFCIFLIPSMALSICVGPVFGFEKGLLLTLIAANVGGTVAFVLGRTLLRKRIERWAQDKPRFQAIDGAVEQNGIKVVSLLRMSPVFPFTIFNYLLSLTRVPYWKYALGTFCGAIPLNAAFLYVSCEAAKAMDDVAKGEVDRLKMTLRIAGIAVALAAMAVISRIAVKAIHNKKSGSETV